MEFEYDRGRVTSILESGGGLASENTVTYDDRGMPVEIVNANGHATTLSFNDDGQMELIQPAAGPSLSMDYNDEGWLSEIGRAGATLTTLGHNSFGWITNIVYADGLSVSYKYDGIGRITNIVDRAGRHTRMARNQLGEIESITRDANNMAAKIEWLYDQQANTLTIKDELGRAVEGYSLDLQGRVISVANIAGQVMQINYGVGDFVKSITRFDGSGVSNSYDTRGRLSAISFPGDSISLSWTSNDLPRQISDSLGTISNEYNGLSRLTRTIGVTTNSAVSYGYYLAGQVSAVTSVVGSIQYGIDADDRLSSISAPADTFNFTYNTNNGIISGMSAITGGISVAFSYDIVDQVTNIVWQNATGGVMRSFAYQFNAVGMITQKVTTANGQLTTNIYCYDSLDRLISETILSASSTSMVNYAYDLAGNRTQMVNNGITVNYTYGQGNQLASWGTNGSQQFDAAGNVTNIHYEDGRQLSLTWDSRYRLAAAYTNGSLAEKYGYDALDRRIWISDGVETNYLIYEGIHCIAETDSSGSLLKSYTYGLGIDNILTMTIYGGTGSTPSVYYYLKDHLGSVQAIADSSGSIVESYCYDAWGNVFAFDSINQPITQSLIGNRILWQAREYSWKTRLYYFRARWYDSVTGRWLSNDPIGISGGVNQYVFCANNPVNMVDPTGLDALRGHGQGMTQNVTWSVISSAWPGSAGVVSSIQASTVAQGVNAALSDLGQPQPPGNIYPYQPDFAGVRNPGFTSGWPSSTSGHGPSWETGVVPGSQYAVKYYADPSRGQVIVLTPPTSSFYHYWQAFRFYFLNENVNQEMAVDFLVNRNYPYWEYNVFPNPYRDDNCK